MSKINPFIVVDHPPRLNDAKWDEYYIQREMKKKVVKTGEGEDDYIIEDVPVDTKISIRECIEAQASDVGLENILKKYALTGDDSILPKSVVATDDIIDFTQMPQDLLDAGNFFREKRAQYDSLPDELKKGRSFEEFMNNFTQKEYTDYFNDLAKKDVAVKEVKEGDK